jgi:glucose-1-phosphate thymidylyltransferase
MSKGIILAGGVATRLFPATEAVSKQALPIYDKPMIYYPLATLMEAGVREILVITNPENLRLYARVLSSAADWGVNIKLIQQDQPKGLAQAITIAADEAFFVGDERVFLILGDNLFHGGDIAKQLRQAASLPAGAAVFLTPVRDPQRYGVAAFGPDGKLSSILEKPATPPSPWAVTGVYSYDCQAPSLVRCQKPSPRGELEITDLNNSYLARGELTSFKLGGETAWLDTGTPDALLEASQYVQTIQHRCMTLVGSPDLVALRNGWTTVEKIRQRFSGRHDDYAKQLLAVIN